MCMLHISYSLSQKHFKCTVQGNSLLSGLKITLNQCNCYQWNETQNLHTSVNDNHTLYKWSSPLFKLRMTVTNMKSQSPTSDALNGVSCIIFLLHCQWESSISHPVDVPYTSNATKVLIIRKEIYLHPHNRQIYIILRPQCSDSLCQCIYSLMPFPPEGMSTRTSLPFLKIPTEFLMNRAIFFEPVHSIQQSHSWATASLPQVYEFIVNHLYIIHVHYRFLTVHILLQFSI